MDNSGLKSHFHNADLEYGFYPIRRSVIGGGRGSDSEGLRDALFMCVDEVRRIATRYLSVN